MQAKLHISPGKESVTKKMELGSHFQIRQIHFTNPEMEDKVDDMSLRAQGKPKEAQAGAPDVHSVMTGAFQMRSGAIHFSTLDYKLPGGDVALRGTYVVAKDHFDFTGTVRTEAKLSQMVATRWKSWLLKPVDPFFHHDGAGAEIPVKISGDRDHPSFSLDLHQKKSSK
jgi:hypothetical protein